MRTQAMVVAICVGVVSAASVATAAIAAPRVVHYLSIGDSAAASPAFTGGVAAGAGRVLHAKVDVRQILEEGAVSEFVAKMETTPEIKADVRAADLITISMGVNAIADALGRPNGARAAEKVLERSYRRLLDDLTRLRPASKTAYRLLTEYDTPWYFPRAQGKAFTAALLRFNRFVCAQAAARKAKCGDVYTAINGRRFPRRAAGRAPHPRRQPDDEGREGDGSGRRRPRVRTAPLRESVKELARTWHRLVHIPVVRYLYEKRRSRRPAGQSQ